MKKVDYYTAMYSVMRRGIIPHPVYVTAENANELLDANFVFLAMDTGPDKKAIVETLTANGIPFIDTGVGLSKEPRRHQRPAPHHHLHPRSAATTSRKTD